MRARTHSVRCHAAALARLFSRACPAERNRQPARRRSDARRLKGRPTERRAASRRCARGLGSLSPARAHSLAGGGPLAVERAFERARGVSGALSASPRRRRTRGSGALPFLHKASFRPDCRRARPPPGCPSARRSRTRPRTRRSTARRRRLPCTPTTAATPASWQSCSPRCVVFVITMQIIFTLKSNHTSIGGQPMAEPYESFVELTSIVDLDRALRQNGPSERNGRLP